MRRTSTRRERTSRRRRWRSVASASGVRGSASSCSPVPAINRPPPSSARPGSPIPSRRRPDGASGHPVHRPVGRSTARGAGRKRGGWGFDGLELACWGDHFEVDKALAEDGLRQGAARAARAARSRRCWAIGAHLVGQAVCDRIDERHRAILPPEVWGDGDPEGVRSRAAERMKDTARAAAQLGVTQVNGFTGSSIWHLLYSFPPNDFGEIERGLRGVRRALGADHGCVRRRRECASASRCIRPRSRTTS